MNSCIIESKLEPPSFTAMHLERVRLSALLEKSLSGIGCVVQAPAGYGKTVALSGWYSRLRECGMSCAWLSLDEHDACPGTFLSYFLSACAKAGFRGFDTVGCADTSASGGDELYRLVLPRLARLKRRHVIILDDFHCAASPEVQAFVNRLLRARLRDLTLVLGTRVAPARIALADLRIGGDVREVLGAELAFDKSELGALFAAGGIPLETSLLSDLHARTRGWPVAVIAAYRWALEGASTADVLQRLSGRDKDLSAYFFEQAFGGLTHAQRRFLVVTSIVGCVNGSLGNALCPGVDGWRALEDLERGAAFVCRAEHLQGWYCFHPLYAEFLVEQRQRDSSIDPRALHRVAAKWFRSNGLLPEAVPHAMWAGDIRMCAEIVESLGGWQFALHGDIELVQGVLRELNARDIEDFPRLWLARVYLSVRVGHHQAGAEDLKRFGVAIGSRWPTDEDLASEFLLIETLAQRYTDSPVTAQSIHSIEDLGSRLPSDNDVLHAVRANFLCAMYREVENYALSDRYGREALERYRAMGAPYAEVFIFYHQGLALMRQARFRSAEDWYGRGLELASCVAGEGSDLAAIGRVFLAECLYETARTQEAAAMLERWLPHVEKADAWLEVYYSGYATQLKLAFLLGDSLLHDRVLNRAQSIAHRRRLPRLAFLLLLLDRDLRQRGAAIGFAPNGEEAPLIAEPAFLGDPVSASLHCVLAARRRMAGAQWAEAMALLEKARAQAQERGSLRFYLQYTVLLAGAEWGAGAVDRSVECFDAALSIALLENAPQAFIEEARLLHPILAVIVSDSGSASVAPVRLAFIRKLHAAMGVAVASSPSPQTLLSAREIEILRCLMLGESNREIAGNKSLSVNTVKFHLKNIYSKLGATSRDEAVAVAIREQLL